MAEAVVREVTKIRQITEEYKVNDGVILHLNSDEAAFLAALVGWKVCGSGATRELNTSIFEALRSMGYSYHANNRVAAIAGKLTGMVVVNG